MSLRALLAYVAAFSVALALTQIDFVVGCWVLMGIVVLLNFVLSASTWRAVAYGGLGGILVAYVAMEMFIAESVGTTRATNYQESNAMFDVVYAWRSYVVQLGAFFGATVGLLVRRWARETSRW
ncbi:hypothetical protein [Aeoliella sp.]|uniref:hypothetical protein n=1 Tax=Aeoliella sp. TaxID=2795800 RepID=UPI003CCBAFE1